MENFNFDNPPRFTSAQKTYSLCFFTAYFFGFLLNSGLLFLMLSNLRTVTKNVNLLLTLNLNLADFIFMLLGFTRYIPKLFAMKYNLGRTGCQWEGFFVTMGAIGSLWAFTWVAMDRYLTVVRELPRNMKLWKTVLIFGWTIALGVAFLPYSFKNGYVMQPSGVYCQYDWGTTDKFTQILVGCVIAMVGIAIGMIGTLYTCVTLKIKQMSRSSKRPGVYDTTPNPSPFITSRGSSSCSSSSSSSSSNDSGDRSRSRSKSRTGFVSDKGDPGRMVALAVSDSSGSHLPPLPLITNDTECTNPNSSSPPQPSIIEPLPTPFTPMHPSQTSHLSFATVSANPVHKYKVSNDIPTALSLTSPAFPRFPYTTRPKRITRLESVIYLKSITLATCFIICWSPYFIMVILVMTRVEMPEYSEFLAALFAVINSSFNPVLALVMDPKLTKFARDTYERWFLLPRRVKAHQQPFCTDTGVTMLNPSPMATTTNHF